MRASRSSIFSINAAVGLDGVVEERQPPDGRRTGQPGAAGPLDRVLGLEHDADLGQGEAEQLLELADVDHPLQLGRE